MIKVKEYLDTTLNKENDSIENNNEDCVYELCDIIEVCESIARNVYKVSERELLKIKIIVF